MTRGSAEYCGTHDGDIASGCGWRHTSHSMEIDANLGVHQRRDMVRPGRTQIGRGSGRVQTTNGHLTGVQLERRTGR